jgi:thiamine-phosphate pyrophosphorylase
MAALPRGLYAITPEITDTGALLAQVGAAIEGGASTIQYRTKSPDAHLRLEQAGALAALCRRAGIPLVVNDDVELALRVEAAGVHLGATDGDVGAARARLGPGPLLGASCYNRFELAIAAEAAGASYVAFGSVYPSATKPQAVRAGLDLFREAAARLGVPAVAIGGITADNAAPLVTSGAHAIAVITDLFDAPDIAARARAFKNLFERLA